MARLNLPVPECNRIGTRNNFNLIMHMAVIDIFTTICTNQFEGVITENLS